MTDRELLQQALDVLEVFDNAKFRHGMLWQVQIIQILRTRLAQPEPELVAWKVWTVHNHIFFSIGVQTFQINDVLEHEPEVSAEEFSEWLATQLRHALTQLSNTAPPKKEWVGLTNDEQLEAIWESGKDGLTGDRYDVARAIEAKLKEKNT